MISFYDLFSNYISECLKIRLLVFILTFFDSHFFIEYYDSFEEEGFCLPSAVKTGRMLLSLKKYWIKKTLKKKLDYDCGLKFITSLPRTLICQWQLIYLRKLTKLSIY